MGYLNHSISKQVNFKSNISNRNFKSAVVQVEIARSCGVIQGLID
jgi:hypothetical protein